MPDLTLIESDNSLDNYLTGAIALARNNKFEAQRLAADCARMLSFATNRVEDLKKQKFLQRVANRFTGTSLAIAQANREDLIKLQKMSFRYLELINERQAITMDSIIMIKNQLNYIISDNIETKRALTVLADKINEKFESNKRRIERLEITTSIHGWLLAIEEFEYVERYPKYIRLLKVVEHFRELKSENWTLNDIRCLTSALRRTDIPPRDQISIKGFIKQLAIENFQDKYLEDIKTMLMIDRIEVDKVVEELSLPILCTIYQFAQGYESNRDFIVRLQKGYPNVSIKEAVPFLLLDIIKEAGIDIDFKAEHQHLALEFLTGVNLARYFATKKKGATKKKEFVIQSWSENC